MALVASPKNPMVRKGSPCEDDHNSKRLKLHFDTNNLARNFLFIRPQSEPPSSVVSKNKNLQLWDKSKSEDCLVDETPTRSKSSTAENFGDQTHRRPWTPSNKIPSETDTSVKSLPSMQINFNKHELPTIGDNPDDCGHSTEITKAHSNENYELDNLFSKEHFKLFKLESAALSTTRERSNSDTTVDNFSRLVQPSPVRRIKSENLSHTVTNYMFKHINLGGYNQLPNFFFKALKETRKKKSKLTDKQIIGFIFKTLSKKPESTKITINLLENSLKEALALYDKAHSIASEILLLLIGNEDIIKHEGSLIKQLTHNKFLNLLEVNPFISDFLINGIDTSKIQQQKPGFNYGRINLEKIGYSWTLKIDESSTSNNMIIYPKSFKNVKVLHGDISTMLLPDKYNFNWPFELLSNSSDSTETNIHGLNQLISKEKTKVAGISYKGIPGDLFTDFKEAHHRNNPLSNPMGILLELTNGKKVILTTFHLSSSNCNKQLKQIIQLFGVLKILNSWSLEYDAQIISTFDANIDGKNKNNDAYKYLLSGEVPQNIAKHFRSLKVNPNDYRINNHMKLVFTSNFIKTKYTQSSNVGTKPKRFLDYIGIIGPDHLSFLPDIEPQIFGKETKKRLTDHKLILTVGSCSYERERILSNLSEDTIPDSDFRSDSHNHCDVHLDYFDKINKLFKSGKAKAPITYLKKNTRGMLLFAIIGYCCKIDQYHFNRFNPRDRDSLKEGDIIEIECEEYESNNQNPFRGKYLIDSPDENAIISIQKNPKDFSNQFYVKK